MDQVVLNKLLAFCKDLTIALFVDIVAAPNSISSIQDTSKTTALRSFDINQFYFVKGSVVLEDCDS